MHFTPTGSSWLNLVERWFAKLTRRQSKLGSHRSTRALENAIRSHLKIYNEDPKPFAWHKTADDILASVAAYCQRIRLRTLGIRHVGAVMVEQGTGGAIMKARPPRTTVWAALRNPDSRSAICAVGYAAI